MGHTPFLCWLGWHRWHVTSGTLDTKPDAEGLVWESLSSLCVRCGASAGLIRVAKWPESR